MTLRTRQWHAFFRPFCACYSLARFRPQPFMTHSSHHPSSSFFLRPCYGIQEPHHPRFQSRPISTLACQNLLRWHRLDGSYLLQDHSCRRRLLLGDFILRVLPWCTRIPFQGSVSARSCLPCWHYADCLRSIKWDVMCVDILLASYRTHLNFISS